MPKYVPVSEETWKRLMFAQSMIVEAKRTMTLGAGNISDSYQATNKESQYRKQGMRNAQGAIQDSMSQSERQSAWKADMTGLVSLAEKKAADCIVYSVMAEQFKAGNCAEHAYATFGIVAKHSGPGYFEDMYVTQCYLDIDHEINLLSTKKITFPNRERKMISKKQQKGEPAIPVGTTPRDDIILVDPWLLLPQALLWKDSGWYTRSKKGLWPQINLQFRLKKLGKLYNSFLKKPVSYNYPNNWQNLLTNNFVNKHIREAKTFDITKKDSIWQGCRMTPRVLYYPKIKGIRAYDANEIWKSKYREVFSCLDLKVQKKIYLDQTIKNTLGSWKFT